MIVLISPAKNMDFHTPLPQGTADALGKGEPFFFSAARSIVSECLAGRSPDDLALLMKVKPDLARSVWERYNSFDKPGNPSRQALFAYAGAVYSNMEPLSWNRSSLGFARKHLRILSALYGCLGPADSIEPYRLDMKTLLSPAGFPTLKAFWKGHVTDYLNRELEELPGSFILNAASSEFSSVVDRRELSAPFVTIQFKEKRQGKLKTVGTYAKMARGKIVRKIMETGTTDGDAMKGWDIMGYRFSPDESRKDEWLFCRE